MEIHKIIKKIFQTSIYTLEETGKGLTNRNLLLTVNQKQFIVRIPYDDSHQILNRKQETYALEIIKNTNLDVPLIYFNEETGIKITSFIPNLEEFQENQENDKIERVARLMKKLHNLHNKSKIDFQPIKTWERFHTNIHHPIYDLSEYICILDEVQKIKNPKVLCHNDWVSGNILLGSPKDYLIDFEYAANNDPLFDIMSFLTENKINDEQDRQRFYQVYFDEITPLIKKQLAIWESFHNLLWCTWAMMMYESRKDDAFRQIAYDKYHALTNSFHKKYSCYIDDV